MKKPIVAIVYDFDKTLCSEDMQNYSFIPALGMTPEEFWGATSAFSEKTNVERILSYMYMMIKLAKDKGINLTKEYLKGLGKDIKFYPGVLTWFKRINEYGESLGIQVEHYLVSSGTKEIIDGEEKGRLIFFSKHKRKILYNLIFKPIPVEKNYPETIMSAVENNGNKAIRDGSISYKSHSYIRKILMAVVVGGIFAYIGYTLRDGFGFTQVVQICMYITTLFTTAVMAFTSGEICSKVHKSHFYLDLANFLDSFNEWNSKQPKITHKEND